MQITLFTWAKMISGLCLFIMTFSISSGQPIHAAQIQWKTIDGGNGHWYEKIEGLTTWEEANALAQSMDYHGLPGQLASITSQNEQDFLWNALPGRFNWLGGFQEHKNLEPDGGWAWVTGEEWGYTNWNNFEPNNVSYGTEDYLGFAAPNDGTWNDTPNGYIKNVGYIVEYGLIESDFDVVVNIMNNPPPLSTEMQDYIPSIIGPQMIVGLNGYDLGFGEGDGRDELVPISFDFVPFTEIDSAFLKVGITPGHSLVTSDVLLFADNSSIRSTAGNDYGNNLLHSLTVGEYYDIVFNIAELEGKFGSGNIYDLTNLLLDGDFNVVFGDDVYIHYAQLMVSGTPTPAPPALLLLGSALIGLAGFRRKFFRR